jgi:hypothetical protein
MSKALLTISLLFFCLNIYSQKKQLLIANSNSCIKKWVIKELKDTIKVKVAYYYKSPWPCGVLATAEVIIVKDEENRLFRVIDLCNTDINIKPLKRITIMPSSNPNFSFSTTSQETFKECEIRDTYFGQTIKIE